MESSGLISFKELKPNLDLNSFIPKARKDPECLLFKNYLLVIDRRASLDEKIIAFDLHNLNWLKIKFTGDSLALNVGTSVCFDEKERIITYGGKNPTLSIISLKSASQKELIMQVQNIYFAPPLGLSDHKAFAFDGKLLMIKSNSSLSSCVVCYDFKSNRWIDNIDSNGLDIRRNAELGHIYKCATQDDLMLLSAQINFPSISYQEDKQLIVTKDGKICPYTSPFPVLNNYTPFYINKSNNEVFTFNSDRYLQKYNHDRENWDYFGFKSRIIRPRYNSTIVLFEENLIFFGGSEEGEENKVYSVNICKKRIAHNIFTKNE